MKEKTEQHKMMIMKNRKECVKCKEDENKKYKIKTKSKCEVCNVYLCKECFEEYHRGLKREIKAKRGRKCNVEGERKKAKVFQLIKDDTPMDIDKENSSHKLMEIDSV